MVSSPQRSFNPLGKCFLPVKALPHLVGSSPPGMLSSHLYDFLSVHPPAQVPISTGILPQRIAMGLGRQMEKAQKPKRSKYCKRRASSMQNICTVLQGLAATPAWCSTSWGVGRTEPHCCSRWGQHPTLKPCNEVATSSLAPLSNLGNAAEPSPAVSH